MGSYEHRSGVMPAEQRDPTGCNSSIKMGGRGDLIKASSSLQDLRRRIYAKAKAEPSWRFWGLVPETSGLRLEEVE